MSKFKPILLIIALLYAVWISDMIFPIKLNAFGLIPRSQRGLLGIITAPFLHGNLLHLNSNAIPLIVMLFTLIAFYENKVWKIVVSVTLISGILLWCFGRDANHIGASGVIYGLASYLIVNGLLERKLKSIIISIVFATTYSGLIYGMTPFTTRPGISWDGHLFGAVSGVLVSYFFSRKLKNSQ